MKAPSKKVQPSTRSRLNEVLLDLTSRLGRAVTSREVNAAYEARFGTRRHVTTTLHVMVERGEAVKLGGQSRYTLYSHRDLPVVAERDRTEAAILEILDRAACETGAALSTGEVRAALAERGIKLSSERVMIVLRRLAGPWQYRAGVPTPAWSKPQIRRHVQVLPGGRHQQFWSPLDSDAAVPRRLTDPDQLRLAVRIVEERLGRPVAVTDLRLWARAELATRGGSNDDRSQAAQAVCREGPGRRLITIAAYDGDRRQPGDRLTVVRSRFTCAGRWPPRFTVMDQTDEASAACLVEDLARLLAPAEELASIERIRETADEIGSRPLRTLADMRERTLAHAFDRFTPPGVDRPVWWRRASGRAVGAWRAQAAWRYGRIPSAASDSATVVQHLEAVGEFAAGFSEAVGDSEAMTILDVPGTPGDMFQDLAAEMYALAGSEIPREWRAILQKARRVMPADGESARAFPVRVHPIDRPDAILAIARACYLPRFTALVEIGAEVLGFVIRDPVPLLDALQKLTPANHYERQTILVALGLLGSVPTIEIACPDPADSEITAAYAAAVALGVDDQDERVRLATEVDLRARGNAAEVSGLAVERLEAGSRLAVLD